MRYMHRLAGLAACACFAALVNPQFGTADTLQKADLNTSGDGLLTIDNNTGLDFLAPSATAGLSYDQTIASPFVQQQGFTVASAAQVQQLFRDAGITNFSGQFNTTDFNAVSGLVNAFLGSTIPSETTIPVPAFLATVAAGDYGLTLATGSTSTVLGIDYQTAAESGTGQADARTILNFAALPLTTAGPTVPTTAGGSSTPIGSFLVRPENANATPEPAGTALLGLALLGTMGLAGRLRRRLN
jgi:hypothetical protein